MEEYGAVIFSVSRIIIGALSVGKSFLFCYSQMLSHEKRLALRKRLKISLESSVAATAAFP